MRPSRFLLLVLVVLFGGVLASCDRGQKASTPTAPLPPPAAKHKTQTAQ